ncbi:disease resistance protein [Dorcoceras hygrometricum]|uniref:Disease resistance protein n=1 Tax=Dorcoceras hygrometricum TaxID=472368 RepID=A0A2Z7DCP2_9LAMI|nr:disease resistance protein [Dorcoceras hygrometricum]
MSFNSLRLAAGDIPDAPHNHLGTRGPSSSPDVPTCVTKIGCHTRISYEELGRWTEDPYLVREYLPRTMSRRKRIPRITEDIRQDILFHRLSPSINTRFAPSFYTHSFLHTFALSIYFSRSRALPDLSIGGASSDTLPAPSDQLFVVADIKEEAQSSPLPLDVPELLDVMVFARRLR